MSEKEILIIDEIGGILSNKLISEFVGENEINSDNKSFVTSLIKGYLDENSMFSSSVLNENKIKLKFISVNENYKCYDALSFPFTSLYNIAFEKWEASDEYERADLRKKLTNTFVLIPIVKLKVKKKYNDISEWRVGAISVWKPSDSELESIGKEWDMAKLIIRNGIEVNRVPFGKGYRMNNNLLKQANTEFIHLRPHGLNSFDYDKPYKEYSQDKVEVTKQSFWLNKKYLNNLLIAYKWK